MLFRSNLIKNALEASGDTEADAVRVITRERHEGDRCDVELSVVDAGPGIDEDILPTLFEPYVTNKAKGTGLGLAIVKKIAEENGGVVSAENHATGGAAFTVRLPALG